MDSKEHDPLYKKKAVVCNKSGFLRYSEACLCINVNLPCCFLYGCYKRFLFTRKTNAFLGGSTKCETKTVKGSAVFVC